MLAPCGKAWEYYVVDRLDLSSRTLDTLEWLVCQCRETNHSHARRMATNARDEGQNGRQFFPVTGKRLNRRPRREAAQEKNVIQRHGLRQGSRKRRSHAGPHSFRPIGKNLRVTHVVLQVFIESLWVRPRTNGSYASQRQQLAGRRRNGRPFIA